MPATYAPTVVPDFKKQPQYIEETTLGTSPTTGAMLQIGQILKWQPTRDINNRKFRIVGNEDLLTAVKNGEVYGIQVSYGMFASTFLKYLVNARGGGAGSIDKTLSILWSTMLNGATEEYETASMCRINSGSVEITPDEVKVDLTLIAANITLPNSVNPMAGVTVLTPATTDPWVGADSGSNPFVHNSNNYDTPRFRLEVARNLKAIRVNGNLQIIDNPATKREIKGTFDVIRKNDVLKTDATALTKRSASYTLKSAGSTLSFTNMQIEQLHESYDAESTEEIIDTFGYFAQSVSLT